MRTALLLLVGLIGCGGNEEGTPQDPLAFNGVWSLTITVTAADGVCAGDAGSSSTRDITVTVTAGVQAETYAVSLSGFLGNPANKLTGVIADWPDVVVTGSYPEDGGTTTASYDLTVDLPDHMAGTETWSWANSQGQSCPNGRSTVIATRAP